MRGEVEVWNGDQLLFREANMLTDGAGKLLADIMTVSPSLESIPSTASILDTSNYTIQAISFGTGADAFRTNGHSWSGKKNSIFSASALPEVGTNKLGNVVLLRTNRTDLSISKLDQPADAGSPIAPNPMLDVLELGTDVSANIASVDVSSVFPGNGQLTNFFPSSIASTMTQDTVFSGYVNTAKIATIMGCFPEGSGASTYFKNRVIYFDQDSSGLSVTTEGGYFNQASSMDVSGFVTQVPGEDSASGLIFSSNSDLSSEGIIDYEVTLSKEDALFAHAYGGIYHLGLWTINTQESIRNGNTPPFAFSVLNNPRKYRLFCRKGTPLDLTQINDITQYQDLTIKWRLKFL